ncbi:hypothetical protein [Microbacterium sp. SS28]|uniref:hypothetical protein n=1 Tax=Microbacterium sp. SS28 TaxID=2919948 RepID=UPI001FAA63A5|nr:hypothetical protein [Microbacterium sp. SS28]
MSDVAAVDTTRTALLRRYRMLFAASALALLAAIAGCTTVPEPSSIGTSGGMATGPGEPPSAAEGWIAFATPYAAMDLMLVRPGELAHRIVGSDTDDIARGCPAFAPGTARLAFGEATGDHEAGWTGAALVLADVTTSGEASIVGRFAVDHEASMPCPIWSADGRWVAFGTGADRPGNSSVYQFTEVWLVDTDTSEIRRLPDVAANDIEWAPDGSQLYIAGEGGISVYSVVDDSLRTIDDTALTRTIALSPDGQTLAVERRRINAAERFDLILMNADGSAQRVLVEDYTLMNGIGPVWSPDGSSIVFQRSCKTYADASGDVQRCYPQHEAVIVNARDNDPSNPAGTQTVIAAVQTGEGVDSLLWFPTAVTWSPDGTMLLSRAWGQPYGFPDAGTDALGVIAIPVSGSSPPVVLYETTEGADGYDLLEMNGFQSWVAP